MVKFEFIVTEEKANSIFGLVKDFLPRHSYNFIRECKDIKVNTDIDKKNRVINFLADERIKINCDYAIASKYGEIHIVSHELYEDRIKEVAAQFKLSITSFDTWNTVTNKTTD